MPLSSNSKPKTSSGHPVVDDDVSRTEASTMCNDAPSVNAKTASDGGELSTPKSAYRVLIVEDDRPQAVFVQSVLRGAGLSAEIEMDTSKVLDSIRRFMPELVLMDLHMPDQDGITLTAAIRKHKELLNLPIVFLSGDPDPERKYDALENGADDFLSKPIRPRHLLAAISSRIQRKRLAAQQASNAAHEPVNAQQTITTESGLHTRAHVLQQLDTALKEHADGGLFFIEVTGALSLRDQYGYASYEKLMRDAAHQLSTFISPHPLARLSDSNFLAVATHLSSEDIEKFAHSLHQQLATTSLPIRKNEALQLRVAVGYAELKHGFVDRNAAIDAVEQAAIAARSKVHHVAAYTPSLSTNDQARAALEGSTLELSFQPIASVSDKNQVQFQVLMRLCQPDGTLLPAAQVVPAAELSGDIVRLDRKVLSHALGLIAKSKADGIEMRLFVSQSAITLTQSDAAQWLLEEIERSGIEPSSLVIDLRMTDVLVHTMSIRSISRQLTQIGVQICLSQFELGTDTESLLSLLPLNYLRVSGRFAHAYKDAEIRGQLHSIIDLAHHQGLSVIAQQIDDPQAAAALWIAGVDFIQGDLIRNPNENLDFNFHNVML